jgi:redox-sensitive bicupin YhaK (pirin superfamily)
VNSTVLETRPLGFAWETADPFLFCVHHDDAYPAGNEQMGPSASLAGRNLGQDFEGKDGWRMYHGRVVPGFPQHPHRGFETVTIARRGLIDHSDSLGAAARFGRGDVQWLTAGAGIVHSEMFPLLDRTGPNPVELFQIWLNLPGADKLAEPHFSMLWSDAIPRCAFSDGAGRATEVTVVAGQLDGKRPPPPPPRSWASRPDTDVAIWCIRMAPGAVWTAPRAARDDAVRTLYFFRGSSLDVAGLPLRSRTAAVVQSTTDVRLEAGDEEAEILLLQGRPIGEPVAQHGPFVMSTQKEIERAFLDYRRTAFGGWPWPADGPVHGRDEGRFARHASGLVERADR